MVKTNGNTSQTQQQLNHNKKEKKKMLNLYESFKQHHLMIAFERGWDLISLGRELEDGVGFEAKGRSFFSDHKNTGVFLFFFLRAKSYILFGIFW